MYYNLLLSLYLVLLKHVGCFWDHTNHNLYVLSINCLEFFWQVCSGRWSWLHRIVCKKHENYCLKITILSLLRCLQIHIGNLVILNYHSTDFSKLSCWKLVPIGNYEREELNFCAIVPLSKGLLRAVGISEKLHFPTCSCDWDLELAFFSFY